MSEDQLEQGEQGEQGENREEKIHELREKHHSLDVRLQQLDSQISLTPEEQLERKTIQKMKLHYKDLITSLQHS